MEPAEFTLDHPCGVRINRQLRASVLEHIVGVHVTDMRTGYYWYVLPVAEIHGKRVATSLSFFGDVLQSAHFGVIDEHLYGSGWDGWTAKGERLRAKHTRAWLKAAGYPTGSFSWGEVWASYDAKSGQGGAGIRYKA
jgi:hypothetical protein